MANNKIIYNGTTLIDLTEDTAVAADVAQGKTFHLADGTQATGTASGGGGDTLADAYTQAGYIYENSDITSLSNYMLAGSKVVGVNLPAVTTVGNYTFQQCTSLPSISLPSAVTLGNYTFQSCSSMTTASLPLVETVGKYAFYECSALTTLTLPAATSIGTYAFANMPATMPSGVDLTLSLPECTSIGNSAFMYSHIKSISIPKIQTLGSGAFERASHLQRITIPATFNSPTLSSTFRYCTSLEEVIFEGDISGTIIGDVVFRNCTSCLVYDFSHCTAVPRLAYTSAFTNINANAQILVPAALEADWKAASNWSTYASHIVGV